MEEKGHVLKVLQKVKRALKNKNYIEIKKLSEEIIHGASIHQDPDIVSLAVIIYSLSKLIERESYKNEGNWDNFYRDYLRNIDDMIRALKKNNLDRFHEEISANRKLIQGLSGDLKHYISDVFRRARINKASKIYEHGISMEKTARILGISLWELAEYSGKTRIGDFNLGITVPIKERIQFAEGVFG